jgi:hypothetical protein
MFAPGLLPMTMLQPAHLEKLDNKDQKQSCRKKFILFKTDEQNGLEV